MRSFSYLLNFSTFPPWIDSYSKTMDRTVGVLRHQSRVLFMSPSLSDSLKVKYWNWQYPVIIFHYINFSTLSFWDELTEMVLSLTWKPTINIQKRKRPKNIFTPNPYSPYLLVEFMRSLRYEFPRMLSWHTP